MVKRVSLVLVVIVALAASPAGAGMETWTPTHRLEDYSCRELLALDESRQNLAFTYFSGYIDGQRSKAHLDVKAKGEVIDKVVEHCRRDAAASVLKAFQRLTR